MQKKTNRISHHGRQRQKQRRKMILIIGASSIACLAIVLTIFMNTGHVENSQAAANIYTVTDEPPVLEKTLDAPVLKQMPEIGPNTMLVRALKAETIPITHN
jgi:hypothetical protein